MTDIIVYYNRKKMKTGRPLTIRVGDASIQTNKLTLENITGIVEFGDYSWNVKRYGIGCPLIIPILKEPPSKRALKERERYRKNHEES